MDAFKSAVRMMFKQRFIVLFLGLIILVYSIIEYYNPFNSVLSILFGFSTIAVGNISENIVSFLQLLFGLISNFKIIISGLLYMLAFLILFSALIGFVFSGYMNIINNTSDKKQKLKSEFISGVKKHFLRLSIMSFKTLLSSLIFIVFLMFASVPAIIITRAVSLSKPDLLLAAIFIDILTIGVIFFSLMFFRIYMAFWYPAAFETEKRAFLIGKHVVDSYFWNIVVRFIIFDVIFIIFQAFFIFAGYSVAGQDGGRTIGSFFLFLFKWVFYTLFFATFISYVFAAYKLMSVKIDVR